MRDDDYRSEARKLRELARSVAATHEARQYYLDLAAIFETLAEADDALARSAEICGRRGVPTQAPNNSHDPIVTG